MSLRSGVLLVPVAINGTSWLAFPATREGEDRAADRFSGGRPQPSDQRSGANHDGEVEAALLELVADFPDPPRSRWIGVA